MTNDPCVDSGVDGARPRDVALIDAMVARSHAQARLEYEQAAAICEFVDLRRSESVGDVAADLGRVVPGELACDEIAAALGWSTGRVQTVAARFRRLRTDLPKTCARWRDGTIDGYTASKVVDAAARLTRPENLAILDDEAAARAGSQTGAQLAHWLHRRVARLAKELGAGDPRSMDQRRADLARDLLLGHGPDGTTHQPGIGVVVPVQSLLGVDHTPGELVDRSNTIAASLAREIAARPGTLFYRLLTDERGHLLDVTELGRFPSTRLRSAVDVRDGTCRWTTCTVSAAKSDCNHTVPHPDGPTTASNLGNTCRRHHRAKTHAGYGLDQPEAGAFTWRTPFRPPICLRARTTTPRTMAHPDHPRRTHPHRQPHRTPRHRQPRPTPLAHHPHRRPPTRPGTPDPASVRSRRHHHRTRPLTALGDGLTPWPRSGGKDRVARPADRT